MTIRVEQDGAWKVVSREELRWLLQAGIITWETIVEVDGKKAPLSHFKRRNTASQPAEQSVEAKIVSVPVPLPPVQSVPVPDMKPAVDSSSVAPVETKRWMETRLFENKAVLIVCALCVVFPLFLVVIFVSPAGTSEKDYEIGQRYYTGDGVEQDYDEAVKWFRKAAEQGYAEAQHSLGFCYEIGEGVKKDDTEAVKWYRKAAEQGYAASQYNLGLCYDFGRGVEQNCVEAVKWYHKATEQGDVDAQYRLGHCYISGKGVKQDAVEALKWFRKAAEQGHAEAQYRLGFCYLYGCNVEQVEAEGVKWLRKAAEQGCPGAQSSLTFYYSEKFEKIANATRQSSNNIYTQRESQLEQFKSQYPEYAGSIQYAYDTYGHTMSMDKFTSGMRQTISLSRKVQSRQSH